MGDKLPTINIIDALSEKLSTYLAIKDSILENEYVELLGDCSKVYGFLRNASKLVARKRFESFLKGFRDDEEPTEEQLAKLMKYIDNEQKAEFIADTFQKILLSKSSKSCLIMGTIMQDILKKKAELTLEDLVCLDALTNFFDCDFENYRYICNDAYPKTNKEFKLSTDWFVKCKEDDFSDASVLLTVSKAVSHQLMNKDDDLSYSMTEPGDKLYEHILRISENG